MLYEYQNTFNRNKETAHDMNTTTHDLSVESETDNVDIDLWTDYGEQLTISNEQRAVSS